MRWRGKTTRTRRLPPIPLAGAEHALWSVVSSASDLAPKPTPPLIDLMLRLGAAAAEMDIAEVEQRSSPDYARWVATWPGEHYRLLAAVVKTVRPRLVVEVGTFRGHGSLALMAGDESVKVVTYDLVPWQAVGGTVLEAADFSSGRIEQRIGDLADAQYLEGQLETLREADVIFVDGPKDGYWESAFCSAVLPQLSDRQRLLLFDDIRILEMVQLWRDLPYPKIDATSIGHWSGTGLALIGAGSPSAAGGTDVSDRP